MLNDLNNVLAVEPNQLRENIFKNIQERDKLKKFKNTSKVGLRLFSYLGIRVAFPELKEEKENYYALSAGEVSGVFNTPNVIILETSADKKPMEM